MSLAFVALGGNLDQPVERLLAAIDELDRLPQTRLLRSSSLYRTVPVGYSNQPDFINAVAMLRTSLSATGLLMHLFSMENRHGRVRDLPNGPRTLDLDLLLYDDCILTDENLVLPHPRMHIRSFVLVPLLEVAPDCEIPLHGNAAALLKNLADKDDVVQIHAGAASAIVVKHCDNSPPDVVLPPSCNIPHQREGT